MKICKEDRAEALAWLRKLVKPGDRVYCVIRHVARSGMSRNIDFYVIRQNQPRFLTGYIGKACGYRHARNGLVVSGCGMDMGFAVVYELGERLWPKGTRKPHGTRNGQPDSAGGYALKHEWL